MVVEFSLKSEGAVGPTGELTSLKTGELMSLTTGELMLLNPKETFPVAVQFTGKPLSF
jgi:hypothetical protein